MSAIIKAILVRLAVKYAAELIFKHVLIALKDAANKTNNTVDDDIVAVLEKEQRFIIDSINRM